MTPKAPRQPSRGAPVRTLLPLSAVLVVLFATATLTLAAYQSRSELMVDAWSQLAKVQAERAMLRTLSVFDGAAPLTQLTEAQLDDETVDATSMSELLMVLEDGLDAHPEATWFTFSTMRGDFLGVFRWEEDGKKSLRGTRRERVTDARGTERTRNRTWLRESDGRWTLLDDVIQDYDPRTRPFFKAGLAAPEHDGTWLDPYIFISRRMPGITFSRASITDQGRKRGVWTVDYETEVLSRFLDELQVEEGGQILMLTRDGHVVAHPSGEIIREEGEVLRLWHASEHPDEMLRKAWAALEGTDPTIPHLLSNDELLVATMPFPSDSLIPWQVLVFVPKAELLSGTRERARVHLMIGGAAILLSLLAGLWISRQVATELSTLSRQLQRVATLDLDDISPRKTSWVRELNELDEATHLMTQGLRSFGRYVPKALVQRIMDSGAEAQLGVEPRSVSVLFADIARFTSIVESTDTEIVLKAMAAWLSRTNGAVEDTGGVVAAFEGDAIMAFWGIPTPTDTHELQACRGALKIAATLDELIAESPERGWPALRTRLGIDSGDVLAGNMGAEDRFTYSVLGNAVNTASRLEGLNKAYGTQILISQATAEAVQTELHARAVDWVLPKGKEIPVLVHELIGELAAASEQELAASELAREALDAMREQRFEDAIATFERARELLGEQPYPAGETLIARCRELEKDPPGPSWDGVYRAPHKFK